MPNAKRPRSDDLVKPFPDKRWDFYSTDRQKNEGDLADPGGGSGGSGVLTPVSPIFGFTYSTGDASHPAAVQLFNPGASGVDLVVWELYMSFIAHASSNPCFGKRTDTPTTLVSPYLAALQHLDEQNTDTIHAQMGGWTTGTGITILTESTGIFPFISDVEGNAGFKPYPVRAPGQYPIIVPPGSALEFTADSNSAGTTIRMIAVFDERIRAA